MPHQFEEVMSVPGRLCLAGLAPAGGIGSLGLTFRPAASSPSRATCTSLNFIRFSHWGQVRKPLGRGACTSSVAPFKPLGGGGGDLNWLELSASPAEERKARDRGQGAERRKEREASEERRWMTRGYRCELSRETIVQQLCGVKHCWWVEVESSPSTVISIKKKN